MGKRKRSENYCYHCEDLFATEDGIDGHNKFKHRDMFKKGNPLTCDVCGSIFADRVDLNAHDTDKHHAVTRIDVRFHFLRDLVNDGTIRMMFCGTHDQVADVLTKPLKLEYFERLREQLGVCEEGWEPHLKTLKKKEKKKKKKAANKGKKNKKEKEEEEAKEQEQEE